MSNLKLTSTITGYFDVRMYSDRTPRENWKMKNEGDNITFTAIFDASDPEVVKFPEFGKPYTDRNGNSRFRVAFKIGAKCVWYNELADKVQRPSNAELDGKQFQCVIQYNTILADPKNDKSPRGYWVNQIQFYEVRQNPFSAMAGAPVTATVPPTPPAAEPIPPMFEDNPLPY